jgi:hypothetical protein
MFLSTWFEVVPSSGERQRAGVGQLHRLLRREPAYPPLNVRETSGECTC